MIEMGETETGRYKVDDKPICKRTNASRRGHEKIPITIVRKIKRCHKCGHMKMFVKNGKYRCCKCKRWN